jgi:pimeloyl-ACP methyl ester carboxylesterase
LPIRRRARRGKQVAAAVALVPFALAGAGWLYQRVSLRRDRRRFPPAGLLLSRGGRYLHLQQQGSGRPAVVFEAGLAASSLSWARVQPLVAEFASAVSYDRAGFGWSGVSLRDASLTDLLDDLLSVVEWAGGDAPVVLVAHSFGALLALGFAQRHPERVAGLVLVDPVSLATWSDCSERNQERLEVGAALSRRGAWLAEFGVVRGALTLLQYGGQRMAQEIGRRAAGLGASTLDRLTGEVGKLPRELWPVIAAHWSRASSFRTMASALEALPRCACELGQPVLSADMPVAILSAAATSAEEMRERNQWLRSVRVSQHRVLEETGHWLHLERAEEVAAAVQWCVERARVRTPQES